MEKGKPLLRWVGFLSVLAIVAISCLEVGASKEAHAPASERSDRVTIETMAAFGDLEYPEVTFFHDKHTEALSEVGKNCSACHMEDKDGNMSLLFKRLEDTDRETVKEIYHSNCIGCHQEMADADQETGPLDGQCRSCHTDKPEVADSRQPMGMDKSLHYRHESSKAIAPEAGREDNCSVCHHQYDEAKKVLFYAKGEEETCRYCHKEEAEGDVRSMADASHASCVSCHLKVEKAGKTSGPVQCAGCHDEAKTREIKKVADVPRMKRNQPDVVLLTAPGVEAEEGRPVSVVAFNHKAHEGVVDDCRTCHHAAMESCSESCHTVKGSEKGGFVQLEQAMHLAQSDRSCVGCHQARQEEPRCAGCHTFLKEKQDQDSCGKCHVTLPAEAAASVKSDEERTLIAAGLVQSRVVAGRTVADKDIPEIVEIGSLSDQYEPSKFPHRKIVKKMDEAMKDSALAGYFHGEPGTTCQGCHHNSPASLNPPKCASCHGQAFDAKDPGKPGLKAAYHQQCMGCHKAMKVEKPADTACIECHKERTN
jgi:hypothetical protein